MVRAALLDSNQHENKWCCAAEISAEVHRCRINSALDNVSPHFAWYGKKSSIHELRKFGCDIYPIPSSPENFYDITQEGSFMGYTNIRATMKYWEPHTKIIKYCSCRKIDEHNNKFGKGWSPGSKLILGKNISALPTLKIELSDHPFIKYDIFEGNFNFPPRDTPIGITIQSCEHHNMSHISQP